MNVVKKNESVLTQVAVPVVESEFGAELTELMSEMGTLMYAEGGVGLAGPQVSDSRRIIVVDLGYVTQTGYGKRLVSMVNPVVFSYSDDVTTEYEGCLSYPGLKVKVDRPSVIHVKYFTSEGVEASGTFKDWEARLIMHEIDHLNGVTLYTKASRLKKQRYNKMVLSVG